MNLIQTKNEILEVQIKRESLMELPLPLKISNAIKLYSQRKYTIVNGIQSFLRDLLSKY